MAYQIQLRSDTTTNWETINPVLADGEIALDKTIDKIKVGDGVTQWSNLPYKGLDGSAGPAGADGTLDYVETTMVDTLTVDPNKSYAITSSDNAVTITLGDLLPNITNYYTVTFTAGTLFSVALNAGTTGKTIKYVDDALPDPVSGKVYNLSILVAGPYAIASARIAS